MKYLKKALEIQQKVLGSNKQSVEGYKIFEVKKEKEYLAQTIKSNLIGVEFYKAKNYTKAIEEYAKAIALINKLPDSHSDKRKTKATFLFNTARAFDNQGQLELAINSYQEVISLDPTHAKALGYLKQCLEERI